MSPNSGQGISGVAPERTGSVSQNVHFIDDQLSRLEKNVEVLQTRLTSVLREPQNVPDPGDDAKPSPPECVLTQELQGLNKRVLIAADRIDDIISRLEI